MNSKGTYFKNKAHTGCSQPQKVSTDSLIAPKTPIKKSHLQAPSNIYSRLSPLPLSPPKVQVRTAVVNFAPFSEMCQVETPLAKQKSKFMVDADQEQIDFAIIGRVIFQSEGEDEQNSSGQMESSQEPEASQDEKQHLSNSEEEQGSYSQIQRSREERDNEANEGEGDRNSRRSTKNRIKINSNSENTPGKKISCNCKKTKCLKLYCDCFRLNQTCDGCNCVGCHNLEIYADQRNNAILSLMDRNPDPFGQKIQADKHVKGCNCKKSNCLKKYCECYQAGLKCGQNCKCQQCKNIVIKKGDSQQKPFSKNTAKKERKMLEM